jgi:pyruvate formate lyase activating enzyme
MKEQATLSGLIFDIKRYAIHDGPGIRITIFLKGCPLSCKWCHNPEGMSNKVQKMYTAAKCIGAQECVTVCPHEALTLTREGIVTDMYKCQLCGKCAEVCPTKAIEMSGVFYSVEEIMDLIRKETLVMDRSGGGVTFSGGEPLMHSKFLFALLDACGKEEIHRSLDTTGFANEKIIREAAKRVDHFLYDLKHMNPDKHEYWTGVRNERILENLRTLVSLGASLTIRIPVIEGVNADPENIEQTARFVAGLEGDRPPVELLPYHHIATHKHQKLGSEFQEAGMQEPSEETLQRIVRQFEGYGIKVL